MHRSFVLAGAFAVAMLPAISLAAPSAGQAHAHPSGSGRAPARSGSANAPTLGVPVHFGGQMRPLAMPLHNTLHTTDAFIPQALSPYRRFALLPAHGSLWYPTLLAPSCAAHNFAGTQNQQQSGYTLGSLVDGKSNLFAPSKQNAAFAGANPSAASNPNPITVQISSYQSGCGMPAFTSP